MDSPPTAFSLSPLLYLLAGVLSLIVGNQLTRRIGLLRELCIPRPVTGGLLFAASSWLLARSTAFELQLNGVLESSLWHTLFSVGPQSKAMLVDQPFLIAFFTCVGLSCSADAVRKGGRALIVLLVAASCLALAQAILGIATATFFGVHPGVGLACGPVSMTGGHGTTAGFADLLRTTGLEEPRAIGFAAATFGLLVGGILSGPLGSLLVRRHGLSPGGEDVPETAYARSESGLLGDLRAVSLGGVSTLLLVLTLLVCFKLGAWLSFGLAAVGLVFPVYMGSMIVGALLRNLAPQGWISGIDDLLQAIRSICIGMFLVLALMNTSFTSLADVAVVMLVILLLQVLLTAAFALWVTYRFAGRNYDAAMLAAGHCGFALGATPNALAAMDAISRRHGRVFRPFLAVSVAGGFFLDFTNALVITVAANWIMA